LFGDTARYFGTENELVAEARLLARENELRDHLKRKLRKRISRGGHTYADRLASMIQIMQVNAAADP
jgi:hypothetical protein